MKSRFIFLDIDGTLAADGATSVNKDRKELVNKLKKQGHSIVVLSNKKIHARNKKVADSLKVPYLHTDLKKPNPAILDLVDTKFLPLEVIGDKYWTDGRFAKAIGAKFTKLKRVRGKNESPLIKLSYILDDLIYKLLS